LHLTLLILGEVSGFILGALAVWALLPAGFRSAAGPLALALLAGGAVAGALGVRWLFRRLGARCPRCGGRAIPRGVRPISYQCGECGHTHETRVRSNW
jgi:DNA-directed RNA polymerase subunit RPC12/RpoP